MKGKKLQTPEKDAKKVRAQRIETAAAEGAVAGAAIGLIAGPEGAVAGAAVGGVVGAITGAALANDAERRHEERDAIDRDIGIIDGEMGAAAPDAPPARIGAYSAASAGAAPSSSRTPTEGPIPEADD